MKTSVITVVLENAPNRLFEVTDALGSRGINILGISLGDTVGSYGTARILVSEPNEARSVLMEKNVLGCKIETAETISLENKPGALSKVLKILGVSNINISFMFSLLAGPGRKEATLLIGSNGKSEEAVKIIKSHFDSKFVEFDGSGATASESTDKKEGCCQFSKCG